MRRCIRCRAEDGTGFAGVRGASPIPQGARSHCQPIVGAGLPREWAAERPQRPQAVARLIAEDGTGVAGVRGASPLPQGSRSHCQSIVGAGLPREWAAKRPQGLRQSPGSSLWMAPASPVFAGQARSHRGRAATANPLWERACPREWAAKRPQRPQAVARLIAEDGTGFAGVRGASPLPQGSRSRCQPIVGAGLPREWAAKRPQGLRPKPGSSPCGCRSNAAPPPGRPGSRYPPAHRIPPWRSCAGCAA